MSEDILISLYWPEEGAETANEVPFRPRPRIVERKKIASRIELAGAAVAFAR
jgi:hypothetical protein